MDINPEAFSANQIASKTWAAEKLEQCVKDHNLGPLHIYMLGGWYALLFFLLKTRNNIAVNECKSFDIDPVSCTIANTINVSWEKDWQFRALPQDVNYIDYPDTINCVINTSAEHMDTHDWFENIPDGVLCLIQSNNLIIDEHVNTVESLEKLKLMYPLSSLFYEGTQPFKTYDRFMIIGKK